MDEIEADWLSIYHQISYDDLDGHKFLRLTMQLPLFQGALRQRLEIMNQEKEKGGGQSSMEPKRTMSMREAAARTKGDDLEVLNSLNSGDQGEFGPLFEYAKG